MNIQHREDELEGVFYLEKNGQNLAEMTYRKEPGRMIIEHTEVDESLRGQNVGFQLVQQGVEYAREANLKIVPLCEFARATIQRHTEFQDVL